MAITVVSIGAQAGSASTTSCIPGMPASLADGNLLICWVQLPASNQTITFSGACDGWTIGGSIASANGSSVWAWKVVVGTSEAGVTFQWTNPAAEHHQCFQYGGCDKTVPIGVTGSNNGNSTTLSVSALTTTRDSSMVAGILLTAGNNLPPLPTNYTNDSNHNDAFGSDRTCHEIVATAGSSDAVSVTITSGNWNGYLIEILAPNSSNGPRFLNSNTQAGSGTNTQHASAALGLPASRTNGDLLVALCHVVGALNSTGLSVSGTGWTLYPTTIESSNGLSGFAWCIVNGSEGSPTFSWTTDNAYHAQITHFSGNGSTTPIGHVANANGNSGTISVSAITTTAANSAILAYVMDSASAVMPVPSGFPHRCSSTNDAIGAAGSYGVSCSEVLTSGASSGALSATITSSHWHGWLIEISSTNFAGDPTIEFRRTLSRFGARMGSRQTHIG